MRTNPVNIKKISLSNWLNQQINSNPIKQSNPSNNEILLIEVKPNTYLIKYI